MMRRGILISVFLGFLLTTGPAVLGNEYTFDYQKIIEVNSRPSINLTIPRGNVSIAGTEDDRIIIEAIKQIRAGSVDEAQNVADHIEIKVRQDQDQVVIQTNYLRFFGRGKTFWQKLLGAGSDSYGKVEYTIAVPVACDICINGVAVNIDISSVEGGLEIDNEFGTTKGEFLFGDVTVKQPSGKIDLQWIEGDVRIKSMSAKVAINQVRGALDITTLTGDVIIRTELNSPRDFLVQTSSGNINFTVPEASAGQLKIESDAGEIETEMPITIESVSNHRVVGEFGRGGPKIHISSSTGDVRVALF